jgi:signal peptidase I
MNFLVRRRELKQLKSAIHHAVVLEASRGDLMDADDCAQLREAVADARQVYVRRDVEEMREASRNLESLVVKLNPPRNMEWLHDNFDVLVVAISVAMAFRAYFYQPFKIPTGSMQPTLYGIHSVSCDPSEMTLMDRHPFKLLKWALTGSSFKVIRAQASGTVAFSSGAGSRKPGYTPVIVAGRPHYVPNDALETNEDRIPYKLKGGVAHAQSVRKGDVLWSGRVIAGDFVFVNRWLWNFRHPRRGEIMVFSTHEISGLQPGTHYIKRMTGLPNETLQIIPPNLVINGEIVRKPESIARIARKEKLGDWAPAYAGFNPNNDPLRFNQKGSVPSRLASVRLGPDEYYAMGDNSLNSFDSRYWGPVPERNLLGPAAIVYWPFTSPRLGRIR